MADKPIRGIHVFWAVFAFFAVVAAVDAYFIVGAVRTFPGEKVRNSYVLGLQHNQEVAAQQRQQLLGWRAQAGVQDSQLAVHLVGRDQAPLTGLDVSARYFLAGRGGEPRSLALIESAPGAYSAAFAVDGPARVELTIEVRRHGEPVIAFAADKTMVIP